MIPGRRKTHNLKVQMKLHLPFLFLLCLCSDFYLPVVAMDFAPMDDSEALDVEATSEDEASVSGDSTSVADIEAEQPEIRVTRVHSLGLRLGEALPHSSTGFIYQYTFNEREAFSGSLARGEYRAAEQNEGEAWLENRAKTWLLTARYLWWPNSYFPFAFSAAASLETATGTLTSRSGSRGDYRTEAAYVSSGLVMSHIFRSGLWLEWTLISINYGKTFMGKYQSVTGQQMQKVRKNLDGLKVLGFANITLGYAW